MNVKPHRSHCRCSPQDSSSLSSFSQEVSEEETDCPGDCLHTMYSLSVSRADLTDTVKLHLRDKVCRASRDCPLSSHLLTLSCEGSHRPEYQGHRAEAEHGQHGLHDNLKPAPACPTVSGGDRRSDGLLPRDLRHLSDGVLLLRGYNRQQEVQREAEDDEGESGGWSGGGQEGTLLLWGEERHSASPGVGDRSRRQESQQQDRH